MVRWLSLIAVLLVALAIWQSSRTTAWETCGLQPPMPVKVYFDNSGVLGQGVTVIDVDQAIDLAWQAWVDLPDSAITFQRVATAAEARHVVRFQKYLTYIVAVTDCYMGQSQVATRVNNDIAFTWYGGLTTPPNFPTAGLFSLVWVLKHEIGHVLGLNHSCIPDTTAIMCGGTLYKILPTQPIGPDAQAAMALYYPTGATPLPTPVPTASPTSSPTPVPSPTPTSTPIPQVCEVYMRLNGTPFWKQVPLTECS